MPASWIVEIPPAVPSAEPLAARVPFNRQMQYPSDVTFETDGGVGVVVLPGVDPDAIPEAYLTTSTMGHIQYYPNHRYAQTIAQWQRDGFGSDGPACGGIGCSTASCYLNADGWDPYGFGADGFNEEGYNDDGYNREGFDQDGYNENGRDVFGDYRYSDGDDDEPSDRSSGLLSYSHKPRPIFHGDVAPWYGMEIEVTTDEVRDAVRIVRDHADDSLIYCKEDGSVRGLEIVTHPMSYEWAMSDFPWALLPALQGGADASVIPQANGIHVHVGRDGFSDSGHLYRWLKLWYRNPVQIQRIARRTSSEWATFDPQHRRGHAMHAKYGKLSYDRYEDGTVGAGRYAAINTTNRETLEVRVFASTLIPDHAKSALQLVAGSVEYTREIDADAICHRHAWEWNAFMAWAGKSGNYAALVAENHARRPRRFIG